MTGRPGGGGNVGPVGGSGRAGSRPRLRVWGRMRTESRRMNDGLAAPGGRDFPSTCWTLVAAAKGAGAPAAADALAELCRVYWYPLFAYIRRRGYPLED